MADDHRYTRLKPAVSDVTQLHDVFPFLSKFSFQYEKEFNGDAPSEWAAENMWAGFAIVGLYVFFVFYGQHLMKDRVAFDLKKPLILWNLFLSLFSFLGVLHTVPHLMFTVASRGLEYSICEDAAYAYGLGVCGFWTCLFIFSKIPELVDTVFIVLRKKKLIFLHWYHHVTVLLYCWHSYATRSSAGIWFVAMNYTVHSIMYFYYYLAARGTPPSWGKLVTVLQLSQMVVGVAVCVLVYYYQQSGRYCDVTPENFQAGLAMYFSYFLLFLKFFIERWIAPSKKKGGKAKKE